MNASTRLIQLALGYDLKPALHTGKLTPKKSQEIQEL